MPKDEDKPKFDLIQGGGEEPLDREALRSAVFNVIRNEGRITEAEPIEPDKLLQANLAKIEDSGYIHDVDVFKLHQGMVAVEEVARQMHTLTPQAYVAKLMPKLMPAAEAESGTLSREGATMVFYDSLEQLKDVYDYIDEQYFTSSRREKLVTQVANRPASKLWEDDQLKTRLLDSLLLSWQLAGTSAEMLGQTPYDLINSIQNELLKQGLGIEEAPNSEEEIEEQKRMMSDWRRRGWGEFGTAVKISAGA